MSEQLYFVSKGRTIRGPVSDRARTTVNGKVTFTGTSGVVYRSHDRDGNPIPLPPGFVEYAKDKKESNGETLLQNLINDGSIVFRAGEASPVVFAKAMGVDLIAKDGVVHEEEKKK